MALLLLFTVVLTIVLFIIAKKISFVKHTKTGKLVKTTLFLLGVLGIVATVREINYYSYINEHLFLTCTATLTSNSSKIVYVLDNNTYIKRDNVLDFKTFFHPKSFNNLYNYPDIRALVDITDNTRREAAKSAYTHSQQVDPYQENLDNILSLSDQDVSFKFLVDTPEGRTVSINRENIESFGSVNATEFFNELEAILSEK